MSANYFMASFAKYVLNCNSKLCKITAQQLRAKVFEFFKSKGHTIIPSASLVPENDPSALFRELRNVSFGAIFLGAKTPGRQTADRRPKMHPHRQI